MALTTDSDNAKAKCPVLSGATHRAWAAGDMGGTRSALPGSSELPASISHPLPATSKEMVGEGQMNERLIAGPEATDVPGHLFPRGN